MNMQTRPGRLLALLPACLLVGACGLLPNAYSGCDKAQPYQSARDLPPLRVPDGSVAPDTHNALRIPVVNAPVISAAEKRCLDHPPSFVTKPASG
jgi:uncharacterized lipoprotein